MARLRRLGWSWQVMAGHRIAGMEGGAGHGVVRRGEGGRWARPGVARLGMVGQRKVGRQKPGGGNPTHSPRRIEVSAKKVKACLHCGRVRKMIGRGLCAGCYAKPIVRGAYPILPFHTPAARVSDADLEKEIAERQATMPEARNMDGKDYKGPQRAGIRVMKTTTKRIQR